MRERQQVRASFTHNITLVYRKLIGQPLQSPVEAVVLIPYLAFWGRALAEVLSLTCLLGLTRLHVHVERIPRFWIEPAGNQMGSHVIEYCVAHGARSLNVNDDILLEIPRD